MRLSAFGLPAQPVDATQALNFSAGVSNPRVLRGRSLSWQPKADIDGTKIPQCSDLLAECAATREAAMVAFARSWRRE